MDKANNEGHLFDMGNISGLIEENGEWLWLIYFFENDSSDIGGKGLDNVFCVL